MGNSGTKNGRKGLPSYRYMLEINSFSDLLENTENGKYESGSFQVGDHEWSLVLYPNGEKKSAGGEDHISLFLKICESDYINNGGVVCVNFKLFVLDERENGEKDLIKNMSNSDANGRMTHFDKDSTIQGFPQFISLKKFRKRNSRYLRNGHCTFGAEVYVKPTNRKEIVYSFMQNPISRSLTFEKISDLLERRNSSSSIGEYIKTTDFDRKRWEVALELNPYGRDRTSYLSIYLKLCDDNFNYEKFYANFRLILQANQADLHQRGDSCWSVQKRVGVVDFISRQDLRRANNRFVKNDTLTVKIEILQVSVVSNG